MAKVTNLTKQTGTLSDIVKNADVFMHYGGFDTPGCRQLRVDGYQSQMITEQNPECNNSQQYQ